MHRPSRTEASKVVFEGKMKYQSPVATLEIIILFSITTACQWGRRHNYHFYTMTIIDIMSQSGHDLSQWVKSSSLFYSIYRRSIFHICSRKWIIVSGVWQLLSHHSSVCWLFWKHLSEGWSGAWPFKCSAHTPHPLVSSSDLTWHVKTLLKAP